MKMRQVAKVWRHLSGGTANAKTFVRKLVFRKLKENDYGYSTGMLKR